MPLFTCANRRFQSLRDRKREDYDMMRVIRRFLSWSEISLLCNSVSLVVSSRWIVENRDWQLFSTIYGLNHGYSFLLASQKVEESSRALRMVVSATALLSYTLRGWEVISDHLST